MRSLPDQALFLLLFENYPRVQLWNTFFNWYRLFHFGSHGLFLWQAGGTHLVGRGQGRVYRSWSKQAAGLQSTFPVAVHISKRVAINFQLKEGKK